MTDSNPSAVALIPARGGSKRLPGKNILDFFGKPMIAYTIEAAIETELFDNVVCSSDDEEILSVAAEYGAVPARRRDDLATDDVPTAPVVLDFLDQEEKAGRSYDIISVLYATAPLRTAEDIRATVGLLEPGICDFAMAVTDSDRQAHQALKMNEDGILAPLWPDLINLQSQDIGPLWFGNGTTYAYHVQAFRDLGSLYGPGLRGHIMPRSRAVDIDVEDDLNLARYHFENSDRA